MKQHLDYVVNLYASPPRRMNFELTISKPHLGYVANASFDYVVKLHQMHLDEEDS